MVEENKNHKVARRMWLRERREKSQRGSRGVSSCRGLEQISAQFGNQEVDLEIDTRMCVEGR